jgi:ribosomal protein S18 acetylase RimI-like enzyme
MVLPVDCGSGRLTGMNPEDLRAAFDEQVRRRPVPDGPCGVVEHDVYVVRVVDPGGGWSGVTWSDLETDTADPVIAVQVARFAVAGGPWEWKHYSYDRPADLPDRLLAAGFAGEAPEALLVAEIAGLDRAALDVAPAGVRLQPVTDEEGLAALQQVHDQVFGGDHRRAVAALRRALAHRPDTVAAVVAIADGGPVAASRMELHTGTDFASLWGGGTLPQWRGRGIFRAMVAHRARLAADRGYRYLQVDAMPDSRPILRRLGFTEIVTTTPFTHPGGTKDTPATARPAGPRQSGAQAPK